MVMGLSKMVYSTVNSKNDDIDVSGARAGAALSERAGGCSI